MNELVTRQDLEALLDEMNIHKGSTVLLQADATKLGSLVGSVTTLLETLFDRIGPKGCLIVPAFTLSALDPVSEKNRNLSADMIQTIRNSHPGYSSRTMPADVWPETAAAFLLHTKVKRTEHPVYSFAWYGPLPYKPMLETLDYPVSYQHILSEMKRPEAVNLLVGVSPRNSIFPMLIAHEQRNDIVHVEHAFVRRVKKTFEESFLTSSLDPEGLLNAASLLEVETGRLGEADVYKIEHKRNDS